MAWPFKYINGEQKEASKALESVSPPPKESLYEFVMSDPETEESPL